jgi:hypothetical protein
LTGSVCCRFCPDFVKLSETVLSFKAAGITVEISNAMYVKITSPLRLNITIDSKAPCTVEKQIIIKQIKNIPYL